MEYFRKYFALDQIKVIDFVEFTETPDKIINDIFNFLDIASVPVKAKTINNKTRIRLKKRIFCKGKIVLKTQLTEVEYSHIHKLLKADMIKFGETYGIDDSQWSI